MLPTRSVLAMYTVLRGNDRLAMIEDGQIERLVRG